MPTTIVLNAEEMTAIHAAVPDLPIAQAVHKLLRDIVPNYPLPGQRGGRLAVNTLGARKINERFSIEKGMFWIRNNEAIGGWALIHDGTFEFLGATKKEAYPKLVELSVHYDFPLD